MMRWMKPLLLTLLAGLGITVFAYLNEGFFGGREICTQCGREKVISRVYWIPSSRMEENGISRFHDKLERGKGHRHDWLFASGGGGAITCALGVGRNLISSVRSEEAVQALEEIRKRRGDEAARLWLGRLLDPKVTRDADSALWPLTDGPEDFDVAYDEAEEEFARRLSRNP
jgi:hypothetical protein